MRKDIFRWIIDRSFSSAAAYYSDSKKYDHDPKAKPWKLLSFEERQPYIQMLNDVKYLGDQFGGIVGYL